MKDLGPHHYFLGVQVLPYPGDLLLCQQIYIVDLFQEVNMHNCQSVQTPMAYTVAFLESAEDSLVDGSFYKRIIGKVHYLYFTRPDIEFAIRKLSQSMHQPLSSIGQP